MDELNILGKFRQGSVSGVFNRVKTRGGEQLLDAMFQKPLADPSAINVRSSIFQYFQQKCIAFSFDVKMINTMREYLDIDSNKNAVFAYAGILIKKLLSSLARDERYKKLVQGLQATIVTLHKCLKFVQSIGVDGGPYAGRIREVRAILASTDIQALINIDIYKNLPVRTLSFYDHLLKGRLRKDILNMLAFISEVDVNIAVSDVAREHKFHYAKALEAELCVLEATELAHPCIEIAVGNDLSINYSNNVLFLTGANMAGKSTLMKAIGINLYLAHMGFPVAAGSMSFSVRDGLYSSINVADNIGLGYSHFYAEVVRVKQAAEAAASGKRLLLMFDELFKGTNVKDAYDGTLAVTEGFADYRQCLFIVSTHIIEVGEALGEQENIQFVFMPTVMDGVHPRYTYKLQKGITEDRQGMLIIRNEGILELLDQQWL